MLSFPTNYKVINMRPSINTSGKKNREKPNIFNYLDYRAFLRDLFEYKKQRNYLFSYRVFAGKAGFSSPNFLKLIIDGKRNLSNEGIGKVAKGFDLKKQERDFFENLVFMNQASTHYDKDYYYKKMMSVNGYLKSHKIDKAGYVYFSKWYYPAIREIVVFGDRNITPDKIAQLLNPSITAREAEKALDLLKELGLIMKNKEGLWEQADSVVTTGPEVKSLIITNYHKEMMKLGMEAIERYPSDERDISAVILSVKKEKFKEFKQRIIAFREELLKLACEDKAPDQVIQINIQAFPLTK
jgi:uncharacterized protein (TIGR02147 family)